MSEIEHGEAGTTLVELLVALALLSLIAVFVGEGVHAVRRMAPVAARMDEAAAAAAMRDHLRRTIEEAVVDLSVAGLAPFRGRPAALLMLAPADPVLEIGGLNRVSLGVEPTPDGSRLDLVERRAVDRGDLAAGESRTVLLAGIRALRLRYAGPVGSSGPDWRESWEDAGRLPALVAVEIDFPVGDRRRFSPLLVRPAASAAPAERRRLAREAGS